MRSTLSLFLTCILSVYITAFAIADPQSADAEGQEVLADLKALQRLLDDVDPPALHAALHMQSPEKFKHGVFQEDRTAIEAVYRENAPLATSIIALAKRQVPSSNLTSTAVVPVVETSTSSTAIQIPSTAIASSPAQPSDSSVQSQPQPSTTTQAGASSSAKSSAPIVSDAVSVPGVGILSSGQLFTTTDAAGITIVTTINGGVVTLSDPAGTNSASATLTTKSQEPLSLTSLVIQTTRLPDGSQSTITAVTVIQASRSAVSTGGNGGVGTTTAPPAGLQTGLAPRSRTWGWEAVGVLGGAVGFAMVL